MSEFLKQAENFYYQGDYKSALKCVEKILKKDKQNADALVIKGNVYYQNHRLDDSLSAYLQVLKTDSQNKAGLINAANAYFEKEEYATAYQYAKQALEVDSFDKTALNICGNSALELEKYDEGKRIFLQLLEMDSADAWAYNSLSKIYQKTNDNERALACGWKAVEVSDGDKNQHINFGYLLYETESDLTTKYAQKWVEKYGADSIVRHMGNAVLHNEEITRADNEYVREIFDAFAEDFESILNGLNYQAPQLIAEELEQIYTDKKRPSLRILDAGCGTGFCGGFLKKYAHGKMLYGVDISEKMLEKAASKKVYDKLIRADLESFFFEDKTTFDLIVSADVFTYFGDLQKVIKGCCESLAENGRILFTVSVNNLNDSPYYLHTSGRFLHHKNYIENLLQKNGFFIEKTDEKFLRNEGENKVFGYLISARKKA